MLIVTGIGFVVYLLGLVSAKIVATEMVGVMQIAYFGLFIVNHSDPLIHSLNDLSFANGLNTLISAAQQKSPNRIYAVGYTPSILSNLNCMVVLLILPPLVSLVLYQIHKRSTKYRIRMEKAWKLAIGEWFLTGALFILYNYSSSFVAFCLFSEIKGWQFYAGVVELILISGILAFLLWLFITKDKVWMGEYKEDFNWNVFSGLYYLIPITQRFLVGVILTAANMSFASGIISVVLLVTCIIIVIVKRPFVNTS